MEIKKTKKQVLNELVSIKSQLTLGTPGNDRLAYARLNQLSRDTEASRHISTNLMSIRKTWEDGQKEKAFAHLDHTIRSLEKKQKENNPETKE